MNRWPRRRIFPLLALNLALNLALDLALGGSVAASAHEAAVTSRRNSSSAG